MWVLLKESVVDNFYMAYAEIAEKVGIRLADPSDPDKCFSSRQLGTILGLEYNSTDWSWSFSKKAVKIMSLLKLVIENKYVTIALVTWSNGHSELIKENGRTVSVDRVGLKRTFRPGSLCCFTGDQQHGKITGKQTNCDLL